MQKVAKIMEINVKEYRDHLRMAEILNGRFNYEDIIYENNIKVPKHLRYLRKENIHEAIEYFSKSYHPMADDILKLIHYYSSLEELEDA